MKKSFLVLLTLLMFVSPVFGASVTSPVDGNGNLRCNLPTTKSQAGYVRLEGADNDPVKVTATGYPAVSIENLEFFDTIDGSAVNTSLWNQSASTMTITQANSFVNLNPANSTTANAYAILYSIQSFYVTSCLPLHFHLSLQASAWNLPTNTVQEFGWGSVTTNAAPTDGVFVRAIAGSTYLIINNNGSENSTAFTLPTAAATSEYVLDIYASMARLYQDGVKIAEVVAPTSLPAATNNNRQPVFFRVYNTASVPASSPTLKLGQISIQQRNANFNKPYADKLIGFGRGAYQSPLTTFSQTTNHTNSTSPTSATLSNTAAGYTTLGGRYQFAAVVGAATDYALFGYQVPAGYQMYVSGVRISSCVTGAVITTTSTTLDWGIGVNSSAVSLATADGAGTWAPRRIPLGMQGYTLAAPTGPAPVGYCAPDITVNFNSPIVVDGGRYFHVILQIPVGSATASQVFRGDVFVNAYFE